MPRPKVCLVPGHGGFDPGACNTNGVREADGNLSVSLKVAYLLHLNNIESDLSRNTDVAIWGATNQKDDVNWQIKFANDSDANIVVAIHFNSSENTSAHGTEVLYSQYPSWDDNEVKLANLILKHLIDDTNLTNRGVKQIDSGIGVIKKVYKPTVLIECAFVSNPTEYIWCSDEDKNWILAKAITKGICKYFNIEFKSEEEVISSMLQDWQRELGSNSIDILTGKGLMENPDQWKQQLEKNVPNWLFFTMLSRIVNYIDKN